MELFAELSSIMRNDKLAAMKVITKKAIEEIIPSQYVTSMLRPINVNELAEAINAHIEEMGNAIKKKILVVDDSGAMLRNVKAVNEFFEKRKAQES